MLCSRGLCWVQHCSALSMSGWWNRALPQQVHRMGKSGCYTSGLCHHSDRSCYAEKWANRNLMNLEVQSPTPGEEYCRHLYSNVGTCWRLSVLKAVSWSFAEKDFGVVVNNELTRYQQCALEPVASWAALGRALPGGQGRGLFLSAQHWWGCTQCWTSRQIDMELLEWFHHRTTEMIKGLRHLSHLTMRAGAVEPGEQQA